MRIINSRESKNTSLSSKSKSKSTEKTISLSAFSQMVDIEEPLLESIFSEPEYALSNASVLAEELDKLGQELAEKPLPETFNRYKKHIRLLLKGIGKNLEIHETTGRLGLTRTSLLRTVQSIDESLSELAHRILNDEKNRIDILKLTNHLQGLILDIIT